MTGTVRITAIGRGLVARLTRARPAGPVPGRRISAILDPRRDLLPTPDNVRHYAHLSKPASSDRSGRLEAETGIRRARVEVAGVSRATRGRNPKAAQTRAERLGNVMCFTLDSSALQCLSGLRTATAACRSCQRSP